MTSTTDSFQESTIKNPYRFMTTIYVASLTVIAILSIIAHLVLNSVIETQSKTGTLVNKSGQQRMLSQRATLFTLDYLRYGSQSAKELALSALATMEENHAYLLTEHKQALAQNQPSPLSAEMQDLYLNSPQNVNDQIESFKQQILTVLDTTPSNSTEVSENELLFVDMARDSLLTALNDIVLLYERESLEDIAELKFAQNVVLTIIIFTIILEALFVFRPMVSKISEFARRLQWEASYDHLSGLYNRRAFFMVAEKVFQAGKRYKKPCSILLVDIDKFKNINDTYGHDVGDLAIQQVAMLLSSNLREADILARFGGEEFLVLLPETNISNAKFVGEKIRQCIEQTPLKTKSESIPVTVSIGITECDASQQNLEKSIKVADENLYFAKNNGRNQICATQKHSSSVVSED